MSEYKRTIPLNTDVLQKVCCLFRTTAMFGKSREHGRKSAKTQIINFLL